ncbi:EPIDERMAL PATTERNING FACTOR-like protein 5 [Aristolochia californica]|uniref:EPIDERMAL PATTERNING FACTOR-like protein 5 n=1 Tax=Aristolochia californica TaxID=171875 RepID=UPI0035DE6564
MALRFSSATSLFGLLFFLFCITNKALRLHPQEQRQHPQPGEPGVYSQKLLIRRPLGGPGSSPPTCRSKCGKCSPCKPVHVPIQPGRSMPLEYYPEAWRCKCGNRLFMP